MSNLLPEVEPLNPPPSYDESNPSPPYNENEAGTISPIQRKPLYQCILYILSFVVSVGGLWCVLLGWYVARTAPFDQQGKRREVDSYEQYFTGMMSIYSLLSINLLWAGMNLYFLREGKGKQNDISHLNSGYDFLIWVMLIAFGVLNMVDALWDRRLCDGWRNQNKDTFDKCEAAQFQLLVLELVAVSLGLLVAVLHFILLIARCCTQVHSGDEARSGWLRLRIREEEDVLRGLLDRRRQLEEDVQEPPLPSLPIEGMRSQDVEGDLIDVGEGTRH